ncbi:MAG: GNAT family N-acetyltransferase [Thermoactinospora sp.]|nr:GNAT family N-acetyltransferase [Thermoactinospora sp.]
MDLSLLVDEAWPALERLDHGPWTFRAAEGVTKRANSVLVRGIPDDLEGAVLAAEAFYASRGLPCVFSLGGGALDDFLAARGYALVEPTMGMWATGEPGASPYSLKISDQPWDGWMESWWAVDGRYPSQLPVVAKILRGVPSLYAAYEEDGVALAVGRGVVHGGDVLGIYGMATLPQARRRGLARAVLRGLRAHAGVPRAYLVVVERNTAAQALYREEGFEAQGGYHYRVLADQPTQERARPA